MADMFTGTVAPDVNTTKTATTTAPQYYTDYLSGLAGAGKTALAMPASGLVAGMSDLQTQGYGAIPAAATAGTAGLTAAQTTATQAAQGITPESIQSYMNPYTQNVTDEMARLSQQNMQRNIMPGMKAGFVGTGGLGGQRYAGAMGQSLADVQSNLTGQQAGALQTGYTAAMDAAYKQAGLQNQAAKTQGELALQEQTMGLTGAGAMTKAGAEQQAYEQAKINAPLTQASNVAALMKGYTVPTSTTETFKGPMAGVYGTSPLAQITGLGTLIGSGLSGTTTAGGTTTPGWLSTLGTQASSLWDKYVNPTSTDSVEQLSGPTGNV